MALQFVTDPLLSGGALLWLLTKGPANYRVPVESQLSRYIAYIGLNTGLLKKGLAVSLVLLSLKRINQILNKLSLNNWYLSSDKANWEWQKEVAVVTGGNSGIALLVVEGLLRKGVKVAVLDIQGPPASTRDCEFALRP